MFARYISQLPEIFLLAITIMMLGVSHFRKSSTPKTYFTLSKIGVAISLFFTIIFYNQSFDAQWFKNTPYTTLFKTLIYCAALATFYLGCKWFLNKNRSSLGYYLPANISLVLLTLAISAQNLLALFACLELSFALNIWFICYGGVDDYPLPARRRFLSGYVVISVLFSLGLEMFWRLGIPFDYQEAYHWFEVHHKQDWQSFGAVMLIVIPLFCMLGIAPFHRWFADVMGVAILPVCTFLTFIPPIAYIAVLINLFSNVFYPVYGNMQMFVSCCAVLSVIIGVIGVNSETGLRNLFAYVSLYNLGVILICISFLNDNGLLSGFVSLLVYLLALFGIYTAFYAFKTRGEYLKEVKDLAGISEVRPYISAALLIFMVSLTGIPPMLGFLGKLSVINYLIIQGSYVFIGIILTALLLLAYAFLNVIKTVYFETRSNIFDRADKGVYICLMINIVLVLISILNPKYLMHDAEAILSTVL